MKYFKFLIIGIGFGIILSKSEALSWFRIYEMFHFQSFNMYGLLGSAIIVGMLITFYIKKTKMKDFSGKEIIIQDKPKKYKAALIGGSIFGAGWAMTGACPGPMFTLVGNGIWIMLVVIGAAVLGAFTFGMIGHKLPK